MSPLLLLLACWLLTLPPAEPSTRLNVQLDPARPTQLYRAPGGDGGPGAWIITASGPRRPGRPPPAAAESGVRRPAGVPGRTTTWVTRGGVLGAERKPAKQGPGAGGGTTDWTQNNRVEDVTGHVAGGGDKMPIKLPSFVVTSRPFGFQGSSNSGQAQGKPAVHSSTSGQSYSTSGQGQTASGHGQRRPPVRGYIRPTYPRPSVAPRPQRPASDSFIFSGDPSNQPTSVSNRRPSSPPSALSSRPAGGATFTRPNSARPAAAPSHISHRPSSTSSTNRPSQVGGELKPTAGATHDDPKLADESAQPADVEPLAAPPSADEATVTRKTAPDAVSTVGGKKLPTFNLGCRQGHRCSFIINAPSRVPRPTYTPYNKQAVDSYLQRFQKLLAISNAKKNSSVSSTSASSSAGTALASASTEVATAVATPGSVSATTGDGSDTYSNIRTTAVPSPGEAYRQDIRRSQASATKPVATRLGVEPTRSSAVLVAQRYKPGTADLYRIMRSSPSTLRTVKPAEAAFTRADYGSQWSPASQWSQRGYREAKSVQGVGFSSGGVERVRVPGQRNSRYTVERVDPKTKTSHPTAWNSQSHGSSNVVPVSGTIFKAHLSSGPINFQSNSGVKRSRSEGSFRHFSAANSNPRTATIITANGVRELPNVMHREFRHRTAATRQYQPNGRSSTQHRLQMAPATRHYAAPPSRSGSVWRRIQPTFSSRRLHK